VIDSESVLKALKQIRVLGIVLVAAYTTSVLIPLGDRYEIRKVVEASRCE
jgi:hypothetical protein